MTSGSSEAEARVLQLKMELAGKVKPSVLRVPANCHYCKKAIEVYDGMPIHPDEIIQEELRTGNTRPLATCGAQECIKKDYMRQDAVFNLHQRTLEAQRRMQRGAESKPGQVGDDPVQGQKKARVRKGEPGKGTPALEGLGPVAEGDGPAPQPVDSCPFD